MSVMPGAKLFSRYGLLRGLEREFGSEATIGRAADNTIAIDLESVSQRHARIYRDPEQGHYLLEDLASLNGTMLDGTAVRGTEKLSHLSVISFGGSGDLIFQDLGLCAGRHSDARGEPPSPIEPDAAGKAPARAAEAARAVAPPSPDATAEEPEPPILPDAIAGAVATGTLSPDRTQIDAKPVGLPSFFQDKSAPGSGAHGSSGRAKSGRRGDTPKGATPGKVARGEKVSGESAPREPAAASSLEKEVALGALEIQIPGRLPMTYRLTVGTHVLGRVFCLVRCSTLF